MDVAWAKAELQRFLDMTVLTNNSSKGHLSRTSRTAQPDDAVVQQAPVVEKILDRVIRDWRTDVPLRDSNRWTRHREAAQRALTELEREVELRERLGEDAPVLDAGSFHPWVWGGAKSLWDSGHHAEAVAAAARKINAEAQNKAGRRDVSEADLFNQCFSDNDPTVGQPRLRLPGDDSGKTAKSQRRGIRSYAEGCYAALRNPVAHDVADELPEEEALEQLAAFSVLARWIDAADLHTA